MIPIDNAAKRLTQNSSVCIKSKCLALYFVIFQNISLPSPLSRDKLLPTCQAPFTGEGLLVHSRLPQTLELGSQLHF